jgi:hypothetical protein
VEFNKALASALLIYKSIQITGQVTINTVITAIKFKAIAPNRYRRIFLRISNAVKAVTDFKSLLLVKGHDMCKEENTRKECIDCKIDGKITREKYLFGVNLTNVKYAKIVNTKYRQCNVYLCRKGKYWERYYNSKKY